MAELHDPAVSASPAATDIHTFLIADVRGYTAYTLQHGDEAAARLAARFADVVEEIIAGRGGRVVELRGDEALVVFASARQALRAAVDLQVRLRTEMDRDPTLPLKVGIGLDAGEAIPVRDGFRGAALNMAARLCSLAGPGEVLASDGVVHLARKVDGVAYSERGMVQLKGFADPVRVIRVEVEAAGTSGGADNPAPAQESVSGGTHAQNADLPFGGFLGALPATPLVGRVDDLARVLRAVDGVAGGAGRLALISGEPGVGKTRLAQEITLIVRNRGFSIAAGRCYEAHQAVSFYPFVEALTIAYMAAPEALKAESVRRWPDLGRLLPSLGLSVGDSSGGQDQQRLFWAVTGLLQALAAVQPVALMLDDLHWADNASLELLQHLARHTRRDRVLLLGTFRDVEINRQHPMESALRDLQREDLVERIDLRRLEWEGTSQLMAASMGEEEISDEFAKLVYGRTEGNPFFVQQVMRVLVERGDLFRREGRWDRKRIEEIEVPESIRSVVGQRLSRLSTETQEVLYEASVLGQVFSFDDLLAMTERSEGEIETALAEAARGGLVRETSRDQYSFDHALTQQSLYGELTTRRRRRLHLAAGEALASLPPRKQEGRTADLAWHFLEGDDAEQAMTWSLAAGDAAMAVFAHSDAEMRYRTTRELAHELEDIAREAEALEKLGGALLSLSRLDEVIEVLEAAAALYERLDNTEGGMRVAAGMGRAHGERGTRRDGIDSMERTLSRNVAGTSAALIGVQVELARLYFLEGRHEDALSLSEVAATGARGLGDDRLLGHALTRRASVLAVLARFDEALEGYREAISLAERTGDLYTLFIALNNLCGEQMRRSQIAEADATRQRQLQVARQTGEPATISWVSYMIGSLARVRGQFTPALDALNEAAAISRSIGSNRSSGAVASAIAVRLFMGEEGALQELEDAAVSPDPQVLIQARMDLALWDLLHDRRTDALNRLHGPSDHTEFEYQSRWEIDRLVAVALTRLGEIERAETMAIAGIEEARNVGNVRPHLMWGRVLMEVRVAQGRLAEAEVLFDNVRRRQRIVGVVFEEAQTHHEFGAALLRNGEPERARQLLEEALSLFRQVGAPPFIARTEELLEMISEA